MSICSLIYKPDATVDPVKLWIPVATTLAVAATLIVLLLRNKPPEPTHRGRPLSYWIEQQRAEIPLIELGHEPKERVAEVRAAINAIGTNGLPFLISWAKYEPPPPALRFPSWAPLWLIHDIDRLFMIQAKIQRAEAAMEALEILGTNAASAIPDLARLARQTRNQSKAQRTEDVLSMLGPEALPPMLDLWSNAPPGDRDFLSELIAIHMGGPELVPVQQPHRAPLRSISPNFPGRTNPPAP